MARPLKLGMDYFPHDTDAVNDEKMEALRALYGNDGYALYFILLERIYRADNAELNISKPALKAATIKKIGITEDLFGKIMETAIDLELFDSQFYEKNIITSKGIKKRYDEVENLRASWRNKKKKKEKTTTINEDIGVISGENKGENDWKSTQIKEKESRIKEIYITCQHLTMTEDEYQKLIKKYGKQAVDEKLEYAENYKNLKNYISLYLTINRWLKKDVENTEDDISDIKR